MKWTDVGWKSSYLIDVFYSGIICIHAHILSKRAWKSSFIFRIFGLAFGCTERRSQHVLFIDECASWLALFTHSNPECSLFYMRLSQRLRSHKPISIVPLNESVHKDDNCFATRYIHDCTFCHSGSFTSQWLMYVVK